MIIPGPRKLAFAQIMRIDQRLTEVSNSFLIAALLEMLLSKLNMGECILSGYFTFPALPRVEIP
ncbi:hypothetical protein D3C75_1245540 [compost metagenome]